MSTTNPGDGAERTVELYFDFVSPYSYLAWHMLPALAARHRLRVVARPVLFAAVLQTLATRGPAEVPARRGYLAKDLWRKAHAAGVPFTLPPSHPFNPLLALRVAAQPMAEDEQTRVIGALFDAVWGTGAGVEGEDAVARALAPLGLDSQTLLLRASQAEAKDAVRANTSALLGVGGFGVPTMMVDGEMFFGSDSLPAMDAFLRGEDPARSPAARALFERWRDLPATARRPGA